MKRIVYFSYWRGQEQRKARVVVRYPPAVEVLSTDLAGESRWVESHTEIGEDEHRCPFNAAQILGKAMELDEELFKEHLKGGNAVSILNLGVID